MLQKKNLILIQVDTFNTFSPDHGQRAATSRAGEMRGGRRHCGRQDPSHLRPGVQQACLALAVDDNSCAHGLGY